MEDQRTRARATRATARPDEARRERVREFADAAGFVDASSSATRRPSRPTTVGAVESRQRPRAGQARRVAVLRRGRRPGLRRGHDRLRRRRLPRARRRRVARSATTRRSRSSLEQGELEPGERVIARVDRARAPRDRGQPHRDAPAARGAAPAPGHPRAPGGLLRRARQAALRLHARAARSARRSCATSRTRSTRGSSGHHPVRALTTTARRGAAARRDGALRREVRRRRAHGRGGGRVVLARALRRHARAQHRRGRASSRSSPRPRARRTCAASRRSPAPRRAACCARTTASWQTIASRLRTPPDHALEAVEVRERAPEGAPARRSRRAAPRRAVRVWTPWLAQGRRGQRRAGARRGRRGRRPEGSCSTSPTA